MDGGRGGDGNGGRGQRAHKSNTPSRVRGGAVGEWMMMIGSVYLPALILDSAWYRSNYL